MDQTFVQTKTTNMNFVSKYEPKPQWSLWLLSPTDKCTCKRQYRVLSMIIQFGEKLTKISRQGLIPEFLIKKWLQKRPEFTSASPWLRMRTEDLPFQTTYIDCKLRFKIEFVTAFVRCTARIPHPRRWGNLPYLETSNFKLRQERKCTKRVGTDGGLGSMVTESRLKKAFKGTGSQGREEGNLHNTSQRHSIVCTVYNMYWV